MSTAAFSGGFVDKPGRVQGIIAKNFRQRLQQSTVEAHAKIDNLFAALDLRIRADYCRFLEANAAALLPLEDGLVEGGVERLFPDWNLRSRREAIVADLAQLGGVAVPLPPIAPLDFAGVLGTMYVLEGSRLGAKVLLKSVLNSADTVVSGATRYLRHGERQNLWRSLLPALEYHAETLADDAAAIEAARRAFDLFAQGAARLSGSARLPRRRRAADRQ